MKISNFINGKIIGTYDFFPFWTFLLRSHQPFKSDQLFTDCCDWVDQSILGNNQASVSWPQLPTPPAPTSFSAMASHHHLLKLNVESQSLLKRRDQLTAPFDHVSQVPAAVWALLVIVVTDRFEQHHRQLKIWRSCKKRNICSPLYLDWLRYNGYIIYFHVFQLFENRRGGGIFLPLSGNLKIIFF